MNPGPDQKKSPVAEIFDIQRYSINDGPGIRTTIFFKGCPLQCKWCGNPESLSKAPQLLFMESLCTRCYQCVSACPAGATTIEGADGGVRIDRARCTGCGACVDACAAGARVISGRTVSLAEVIEIVKKDSLFYRVSGGGVTASGGEPTTQPEFLTALFQWCQKNNIFTTLDTCGYVRWEVLKDILEFTELVYFDIKHMDSGKHHEYTGVGNELILENARRIVRQGNSIRIRMPLIPGVNDTQENIRSVVRFIGELGLSRIDLLPYHQLGKNKYARLGKDYSLSDKNIYDKQQLEEIVGYFVLLGVQAHIA
ncbi:MAG: glycyl-radical enzyme activating protein [Desulfobacterales bacterium]|nr:glycyl-radical enzyme activating protein [Desulfobacterales bacterium]